MKKEYMELLTEAIKSINENESQTLENYTPPVELSESGLLNLPDNGVGLNRFRSDMLEWLKHVPSTATQSFANQLFGGREDAAVLGEMLAAYINSSMYTYKVAGVMTLFENALLKKLTELFGFQSGEGQFLPGGSMSVLCAMLTARNTMFPKTRERGWSGIRATIYTSEYGHYSVSKNANILGLGRDSVRIIPAVESGEMDVVELENMIIQDLKADLTPFLINATVGSTVLGSFDDLTELEKISRKYNLWLHADASFGGGLIFHPEHRKKLKGIEKADSISYNPHKLTGVPLQCSVALFSKKNLMGPAVSEEADYLFQTDKEFNPGFHSLLCGRRNDALKLWCHWQIAGTKGLADRVETQMKNAEIFAGKVEERSWQLYGQPKFINICFRINDEIDHSHVCKVLNEKGLMKVGYGSVCGKTYIRMVCVNPELTEDMMDKLLDNIASVAGLK